MRIKIFLLVAAVALALLVPGRAAAISCSGTQVTLTNNNFGFSDISVTLCITQSGGNTIITLDGVTGDASTGGFTFINQIGVNGTTGNQFVSASTGGWSQGPGNCNGFDGFAATYTSCGQGPGNNFNAIGDSWVFSGTFTPDQIVLHVGFANCTGFIGGSADTNSTDAGSSCTTTVPETSSGLLSLLGMGLLASFGILRRLAFS
jgi:hypothetical protein